MSDRYRLKEIIKDLQMMNALTEFLMSNSKTRSLGNVAFEEEDADDDAIKSLVNDIEACSLPFDDGNIKLNPCNTGSELDRLETLSA